MPKLESMNIEVSQEVLDSIISNANRLIEKKLVKKYEDVTDEQYHKCVVETVIGIMVENEYYSNKRWSLLCPEN